MALLPPETTESAARRRSLCPSWPDAGAAARLLGIPTREVDALRRRLGLLGVWVDDRQAYLFPDFQFVAGRPAACLPELLALIPNPSGSGWEWAEWFLAPHACLDGQPPMDRVAAGRSDEVLAAAREEYRDSAAGRW